MGTSPAEYENYFALMYTLYAFPNIILPFFGGYFVDTFGVCISLLVSTSLLALGQIIVAIGFSAKSWVAILAGRFVFALGGENLIVASSALLADWFIGKELAFSFGINLALSRMGSVLNNYCSVYFARTVGVVFANWAGAIICGLSVLSVILTIPIDRAFDKSIADAKNALAEEERERTDLAINETYGSLDKETDAIKDAKLANVPRKTTIAEDIRSMPLTFWVLIIITVLTYGIVIPFNNVASSLLLERTYFVATPPGCTLQYSGQCQSSTNPPTCFISDDMAPPLPTDVTVGPTFYAQVTAANVDCNDATWTDGCASDYCSALAKAEQVVSVVMSIPYTISGVASPIFGMAVDYYGQRATMAAVSEVVLIAVHATLAWSTCSPVAPLVGQGIAYTTFAAVLWPAIPLLVKEEQRGLAFGIGTASYNLGCAIVPLLAASIYTHSENLYIPNVEILFVGMAVVAFVLGVLLIFLDKTQCNGILNRGLVEEKTNPPVSEPVYSVIHRDEEGYKTE